MTGAAPRSRAPLRLRFADRRRIKPRRTSGFTSACAAPTRPPALISASWSGADTQPNIAADSDCDRPVLSPRIKRPLHQDRPPPFPRTFPPMAIPCGTSAAEGLRKRPNLRRGCTAKSTRKVSLPSSGSWGGLLDHHPAEPSAPIPRRHRVKNQSAPPANVSPATNHGRKIVCRILLSDTVTLQGNPLSSSELIL